MVQQEKKNMKKIMWAYLKIKGESSLFCAELQKGNKLYKQ
jgi:hypothetical protein